MKKRIYSVTRKMSEKAFVENEKLSPFKQQYEEYLEPQSLMTESQLIDAIRAGIVINCAIQGVIEE